jgi:transcription initiation factor TFIID TATA-box-binding protein
MNPVVAQIQNVVATANVKVKPLDLNLIARKGINVEYNPRKFVAAIMRIRGILFRGCFKQ